MIKNNLPTDSNATSPNSQTGSSQFTWGSGSGYQSSASSIPTDPTQQYYQSGDALTNMVSDQVAQNQNPANNSNMLNWTGNEALLKLYNQILAAGPEQILKYGPLLKKAVETQKKPQPQTQPQAQSKAAETKAENTDKKSDAPKKATQDFDMGRRLYLKKAVVSKYLNRVSILANQSTKLNQNLKRAKFRALLTKLNQAKMELTKALAREQARAGDAFLTETETQTIEEKYKNLIQDIDTNGDEEISQEELQAYQDKLMEMAEEGDMPLSPQQKALLKSMKTQATRELAQDLGLHHTQEGDENSDIIEDGVENVDMSLVDIEEDSVANKDRVEMVTVAAQKALELGVFTDEQVQHCIDKAVEEQARRNEAGARLTDAEYGTSIIHEMAGCQEDIPVGVERSFSTLIGGDVQNLGARLNGSRSFGKTPNKSGSLSLGSADAPLNAPEDHEKAMASFQQTFKQGPRIGFQADDLSENFPQSREAYSRLQDMEGLVDQESESGNKKRGVRLSQLYQRFGGQPRF